MGWSVRLPGRYLVCMRRAWPLAALLITSCAPSLSPTVRGSAPPVPPVRVAVFPFLDQRETRDGELSDDAAVVVREAVVRELARRNCPIAAQGRLDTLVSQSGSAGDFAWGEVSRLGQKVGADLSLVGRIHKYRRGSRMGASTVVAVRLDLVDPNGRTAWTLKHQETAAQEDPAVLARDVALKMADAMVASWGGCPAKPL